MGFLLAAGNKSTFEDLIAMDPIEREFLAYWTREREFEQMEQLGRLLGVMFDASEIRSWGKSGGGSGFDDTDSVLVPLTFMLNPDSRQAIQKMVGSASGLTLPAGYRKGQNEYVVDLGKVSPQEFMDFVRQNQVQPKAPTQQDR